MKSRVILIAGSSIGQDTFLIKSLRHVAKVYYTKNMNRIKAVLNKQDVDIIILEIGTDQADKENIIENLMTSFENLKIILINDDRDIIAQAFSFGIVDAFRRPFKIDLLIERIIALFANVEPKD